MVKVVAPDAWKYESYLTSHVKGKLRYHDHEFFMVKEKVDGKVHPKYYALVTVDRQPVACGSKNNEGRGSYGPQSVENWQKLFEEHYPPTDQGQADLKSELERILG